MNLPIACTLTDLELKERRQTVLDPVRESVLDVVPMQGGYTFRFASRSDVLQQLTRLVDVERQCCRFLTFTIVVEAGEQPIRLEITGPPEAMPIIENLFGQ